MRISSENAYNNKRTFYFRSKLARWNMIYKINSISRTRLNWDRPCVETSTRRQSCPTANSRSHNQMQIMSLWPAPSCNREGVKLMSDERTSMLFVCSIHLVCPLFGLRADHFHTVGAIKYVRLESIIWWKLECYYISMRLRTCGSNGVIRLLYTLAFITVLPMIWLLF